MATDYSIADLQVVQDSLTYNPETGNLTWLKRPRHHFKSLNSWASWNALHAGEPAGCPTARRYTHYLSICLNNKRYLGHRVAWALHYGAWPTGIIDHINRDGLDNRLLNLRVVSHGVNNRNSRRPANNTSGKRGVSYDAKNDKWVAYIDIDGKRKHLGRFINKNIAIQARISAESKLFGYGNEST